MAEKTVIDKLLIQLITDGQDRNDILSQVEMFLEGGGRWVQLRMKDMPESNIIETGKELKKLCSEHDAVFILNDHPHLVEKIGADGVHIGKNDISPAEARKILGSGAIIGCTANTFEDIRKLKEYDIDYIGLGPYRFTTTKKNLSPVLGEGGYREIFNKMKHEGVDIPVTAIGGIVLDDVPKLLNAGVKNIAVSGAVNKSANPRKITEEFLKLLRNNI
ncbi:MAG: thiamine phosphate synthase [Rikenellaceae bacterium]|nr:thiamine phosphate synthase [Rikenellaceae bacterium]